MVASAADVAGNVALVSDYRFRGISQNNGKFSPAIQGGFDWSSEIGFYVGTWASNVNFSEGSIETDLYGGYKGKFNDDYAYDVGILYYGYPQDGIAAPRLHRVLHEPVRVRRESRRQLFAQLLRRFGSVLVLVRELRHRGRQERHTSMRTGDTTNSKRARTASPRATSSFGDSSATRSYADWSLGVSTAALGVTWG